MTSEQIARIRASWALAAPSADMVAALFYDRLFTLDRSLAGLFAHTDLAAQRQKLMQMLGVVVAGLDELPRLLPAVEALGRRHRGYRVRDVHYATVGEALLWTLGAGLGDAFDDATREAWTTAYLTLAGVMQRAAAEPPPQIGAAPGMTLTDAYRFAAVA